MRLKAAIAILLSAAAMSAAAGDPVYRYTDAGGTVHYSDRAPDRHAKPIRLAPLSGAISREASKARIFYPPEALREAARFSVRVESPTPGERFGAGRAPTVAAASVMPGLVKGFRLVYQLNGRAVTAAPVDALSIALRPLPAGEHGLVVVLLDPKGQEVARSVESRFVVGGAKAGSGAPRTISRTEIEQ